MTRPEPSTRPAEPASECEFVDLAWRELIDGVGDDAHGFHWPVLASVDASGAPRARVVVLRGADPAQSLVTFHTDRRSAKVAELLVRPEFALTFHDGPRKLQVRATGVAQVLLSGELFEASWARTGLGSRRCYLAPHAPSDEADEISHNLPSQFLDRIPSREATEAGRVNFAVVACSIQALDILVLGRKGHRRGRVALGSEADDRFRWLHP